MKADGSPAASAACLHRPLAPMGRAAQASLPGAVPCAAASRPWVLAATILASAMAFIDASVATIVLPVLQRELGAGLGALQWVVNGYTLPLAALLLVGGAAGDRFGRRRVFVAGTVLFALASAACALAPGTAWLIATRAVQGVGAAMMVPQSLAIIAAAFPPAIRGRAIGTWAGAASGHHRIGSGGRWPPGRQPGLAGGVLDQLAPGRRLGGVGSGACAREPLASGGADRLAGRRPGDGGLGVADTGARGAGRARGRRREGGRAHRRRHPGRRGLRASRAAGGGTAGAGQPLRGSGFRWGQPDDALSLRCASGGDVPASVRHDRAARAQSRRGWDGHPTDGAGDRAFCAAGRRAGRPIWRAWNSS